ncbi:Gfo/Idh/MocA family oxidoreductase [Candidatus Woesearchaeota archaeon]|nr:Gfo/Idh/MocA family oxidoreductase [Candidatus Woesearchaeota archaeon]
MKYSKVRFGILGCSNVAKKSMLPAMKDSESAEISMIGSRTKQKATEYCKIFGCNAYGTYEDVINNKGIDAVYISLPAGLHEEWTVKAAKAGKHVLCEKPATTSLASAKRMSDTCRKNKVRLLEGFMFKHHPQHKKAKELIKNGVLGELLNFYGCFAYRMPDSGNIRLKKELGGGVMNDSMPYPVYAGRMFFGEPVSVVCSLKIDKKLGVDLKADIIMGYQDGKTAFASSAFGSYYQSTYSILGSKAFLRMKRAYAITRDMETSIFLDEDDKSNEIIIEPADHFRLMVDDFCAEIMSNKKSKNYEEDLLAQAKVLEAARISHKEKRIVKISELRI